MTALWDDTPTNTMVGDSDGTGIVGNRHLIAVQTFDVARLTTHPIPLVPGAFIAVSGQGPKGDSNGSGKTSFLAAVSLLLGDAQWRLEANGSQYASGVLFSPASAGLDASGRYSRAEKGYIVGIFADVRDLAGTVMTVWMRIAQSSPYIKVRWTEGLHIADGDSDVERHQQSDALWTSLPRHSEMGARTFGEALYGDAPRCMAYLDTPLRPSTPSLLSQEMTKMTPAVIGEALIELTGRQGLLEKEEKHRARLAEKREDLHTRQGEDHLARVSEQADLDAVGLRRQARSFLRQGEHAWKLHYAKGYLDVLVEEHNAVELLETCLEEVAGAERRLGDARSALAELQRDTDLVDLAETAEEVYADAGEHYSEAQTAHRRTADALTQLNERRPALLGAKEGWTGAIVPDAGRSLRAAQEFLAGTTVSRVAALRSHQSAQSALVDIGAGGGGPAGDALKSLLNAGIPAVGLLDVLTIAGPARPVWEPRVWPHRSSVVIAPTDEPAAVRTLASHPGAEYVLADGPLDGPIGELPAGISSDVPLGHFLTAVHASVRHHDSPDRAFHIVYREGVLGGFPAEIAGRTARVAAAQELVAATGRALATAEQAEKGARLSVAAAEDDLAAAEAVVQLSIIDSEIPHLQAVLANQERAVSAAHVAAETARKASARAQADVLGHTERVTNASQAVTLADHDLSARRAARTAAQTSLERLDAPYWRLGWGGTEEQARAAMDAEDDATRRISQRGLRGRAADALNDALDRYESSVGGVLSPALSHVRQRREQLRDNEPGVSGISVEFGTAARPLRDALDERVQTDEDLQTRITDLQAARADAIVIAKETSDTVEGELETLRGGISQRIEQSLSKISVAWNRLSVRSGGFGAKLKITDVAPVSPTSPWTWEVTPMWRRSSTSPFVSYKENANGAQVKLYAIQLVLAALLATDGAKGRVLVLDELGNSLGDVNRKDALDALATVAREQEVTILGTCQDSVIGDAASACGEILWFSHAAASDAYNQPTRMWGFDENGDRIRLTADWITAGRNLV